MVKHDIKPWSCDVSFNIPLLKVHVTVNMSDVGERRRGRNRNKQLSNTGGEFLKGREREGKVEVIINLPINVISMITFD